MIIDRECPKHLEENLFQCQFVNHKSHVVYLGFNPGLRSEKPATNNLRFDTAGSVCLNLVLPAGQQVHLPSHRLG